MKRAFTFKAVAVSMGLAASLWTGRAIAEEEFGTLAGIEAQAISPSEMAAVEGKLFEGLFFEDLFGNSFLGLIPNLSGGGGIGDGGAITVLDPKEGLLASRRVKSDLGLLVLNLSGLTPPELRPKNNSATGVLGPDGLLFDVNAGRKAPFLLIQLEGLSIGDLGN